MFTSPGEGQTVYPTFLGIGSMRCGSTWLYKVLKAHPEIHMSPAKELDFLFMQSMLKQDLSWYSSQFRSSDLGLISSVRGEISPRYARLKRWQVKKISQLIPDLKVIYTIRHPIERVWSQAVYDYGFLQKRDISRLSTLTFLRQFERARTVLSSDYERTIDIWSGVFGKDALHIDLFDRLRSDPEGFLNDTFDFLGVESSWRIPEETLRTRVYSTNSLIEKRREIPELVRWYIADQWLVPMERLNDRLDGRISHWTEEMKEISGGRKMSWKLIREVNRLLLSVPENLAFHAYDSFRDLRLWLRWRQLRTVEAGREGLRGRPVG